MREEQLKNSTILFLSPLCARERNAPKEFEKEERRATESLERENLPSASDFALLLCSSPSCSAHRQLRKPSVRPSVRLRSFLALRIGGRSSRPPAAAAAAAAAPDLGGRRVRFPRGSVVTRMS